MEAIWQGTYEGLEDATGVSKENMWSYVRRLKEKGLISRHEWEEGNADHEIIFKPWEYIKF